MSGRQHPLGWILAGAIALGLGFVGCAPTPEDPKASLAENLPPLPPDEGMESAVRAQFEERRALIDAVLARPDASDVDIAWALGQMGRVYQAYRHLDQAIWCYREAHRLDPSFFDWAYLLGQIELLLGDEVAAEQYLDAARALRPDLAHPLVALGQLAFDRGDLETAEQLYRQALERAPDLPLAGYGMARVEIEQGRHADAAERLRRLLEEQPRAFQLLHALADALKRSGRVDEARDLLRSVGTSTLERTSLRSPDPWLESIQDLLMSVTAFERRGRQALMAGRVDEAIRWFHKGETIAPERREVRYNLAIALARARRPAEAAETLRLLRADHPEFASAYRLSASVAEDLGEGPDVVLDYLEQALERDPDSASNLRAMGVYWLQRGRLERATEFLERSLLIDATSEDAHVGLVLTELVRQRSEAAEQAVRRGLEAVARPGRLLWLEVRVDAARLVAGRVSAAPRSLPGSPRGVFELESAALLRAAQGDFASALRFQEQAVKAATRLDHFDVTQQRLESYRSGRAVGRAWAPSERIGFGQ